MINKGKYLHQDIRRRVWIILLGNAICKLAGYVKKRFNVEANKSTVKVPACTNTAFFSRTR
jgi:mannose-6-phosphate isomerase-like protein (cupin superfamily)